MGIKKVDDVLTPTSILAVPVNSANIPMESGMPARRMDRVLPSCLRFSGITSPWKLWNRGRLDEDSG